MTRAEAREQAFILIFESGFTDEPLTDIIENAVEGRQLERDAFSFALAQNAMEHREQIDYIIEKHSKNWKMNRIPRVSLALLRLALGEIYYYRDNPAGVAINEAVELAKKYGSEDDYSFINGVLGNIVRNMKDAEAFDAFAAAALQKAAEPEASVPAVD